MLCWEVVKPSLLHGCSNLIRCHGNTMKRVAADPEPIFCRLPALASPGPGRLN